jgi:glycosyltransferase involved in cell wall biosynthesis
MSAIKIAHITTVDSSLRYLLLNQLRAIKQAGYDVVGISAPGPDVALLQAAGIRHRAVALTRTLSPLADLVALSRLARVIRDERCAIVHTHTPKAGLLGQLGARLAGVPVVVNTIHGFYFHDRTPAAARRFYIALERVAARCSSAILSQNQEDIATAIRERICPHQRIQHLGNGIDLALFDPARFSAHDRRQQRRSLGIPEDARAVGFVGRLAAVRKGFLDFLRACAQVGAALSAARFLVVGEPDRGKADMVDPATAAEYGIADHCIFLGQLPNEELPAVYAAMDLLVLPSLFEGVPRVAMEAAAMGLPVVATDVKGNREVVEHRESGLLVPYGAPHDLAGAILAILRSPELARSMSEAGRQLALRRFDERRVFERVLAVYARQLRAAGVLAPERRSVPFDIVGSRAHERPRME